MIEYIDTLISKLRKQCYSDLEQQKEIKPRAYFIVENAGGGVQ